MKNIKKLNINELINLKENIENQIEILNKNEKLKSQSETKTKLSHLNKNDKIFCIEFSRRGHYDIKGDYVNININKYDNIYKYDDKDKNKFIKYTSTHKTKPLGATSSLLKEDLDNYFFLDVFYSSYEPHTN